MIQVRNLTKCFNTQMVLNNINLTIQSGEVVAIIGPSGSGKSTLLRSINLLEIPDSGKIVIDDVELDVKQFTKKQLLQLRRKSAMVFQNFHLFINKNVVENVSEALISVQKLAKKQAREIALEQLRSVALEHKANAYPYELSGGQQQRVAIARALALNTNVILLDEPTSALDVELIGEVLDVIRKIKNKTMLLVTHELKFAKAVADRILFMDKGEIIEHNLAKDFFENVSNERVKNFLARIENLH
ncbi:amino acid ABC transporter ATP-binding protein [Campylobacter sp. MIT 21-1685]|uniref:amino acid ABC transporter ATP-binding protein n=1 Tax=unclassified Campylobacter TaxID=2593542 RepID=UPI00224ACA5F|nr:MULTISPECIES: amino acid ABC transporter ATP-binding protein [unclassified Campylobacter]MCX2682531.1 amino acid ABC transporter ATP-binding protein [Campylobacter sp. MIT 21-1684]MCX2750756.1 amino acid ABC transporter ATP-binding protein [Campylobacter sp. MIT 21-1682]MCX2807012.1 amino acid ABC transporter ATP-binding protein [Campylobacter sp. MIT 21-1685]